MEQPAQLPARHRLFLGVLPPSHVGAHIAGVTQDLRSEHELFGAPLEQERLHITVLQLGDYVGFPPRTMAFAHKLMDDFHFRPFTANFDLISSLGGRTVPPRRCAIALRDSRGARDLQRLRRLILSRLPLALLKRMQARATFTPHITVLYDEQNIAAEPVSPIRWIVTNIALVHSRINRGRLQPYSLLGRWRLI